MLRNPSGRTAQLRMRPTVTNETDLPTPKTTLASRYVRVVLTCWQCRHQADMICTSPDRAVPSAAARWVCDRERRGWVPTRRGAQPGSRGWLMERRRIGSVVRRRCAATDPLFR
jgi:hypothetical protein